MISAGAAKPERQAVPDEHRLPVLMLSQYLYFLSRRPVSESNLHYLVARLQGLQSLGAVFADSGLPVLERVTAQLRELHPAAFRRIAASLQLSLLPLARAARELPGDVVVQDSPPPRDWLSGVRRALLVFGPGIGIGDELIVAPLPRWLKSVNPALEVTTLSGYTGFWNRVAGVDRELRYSSHLELLEALRGVPPYDDADLVILVDFEAPELYRGVAADHRLKKYLEISLGARSAFLVDAERRWLYRVHHITPYFANYYHAFHQTVRSLGMDPLAAPGRFAGVVERRAEKAADRLDVLVTPFTSKYDPSGVYWGRLLTGLARRIGPFPVTLHLDTGNNWRTQRFAVELARSIAPRLPSHVEVRLAHDRTPPSLSLAGVYDSLDRCHAVVCADSFAAHAGPLFDCVTIVVAKAELRDWQVPFDGSYYFDAEWPIEEVAAAMGNILHQVERPQSAVDFSASFSQAELDLCAWGCELDAALQQGQPLDGPFLDLYRKFVQHYRAVAVRRRAAGAPELLFRDSFHDDMRVPDDDREQLASPAMALHLRDQLERWQNTNFAKYGRWARRRAVPDETMNEALEDAAAPSHDSPPAIARQGSPLSSALLNALRSILREQLPSGEIATYFRFGKGALEYRRAPLLSSFVHDALGSFDLKSRWVDTDFFDALPAGMEGRFVRAAALVRNRIRSFLLWEEGSEGGWWFNGRGSGLAPDVETTACAATAVLQAPRRKPSPRWQAHASTVLPHGDAHNGNGDLIARVNILRFLALIGEPVEQLASSVLDALRERDAASTNGRYVQPLVVPFCVARAWTHAALPRRAEVTDLLVPGILRHGQENANFGGVLGTALALNALLDLEYSGPEIISGGQYLLETTLPPPRGGWAYAAFLENGGGSPAFTSALAMSALARSGVGR
jgi:hypothetical protein